MKVLAQVVAIMALLTTLTGCLDPQDGSNGRPQGSFSLEIK